MGKLSKDGDCCPGLKDCAEGSGPYAMSTGGDYPSLSSKTCDGTEGCMAFGQMFAYVTHFHFASRGACMTSQNSNTSLGEYHCDAPPRSPTVASFKYLSTAPQHGKMPFVCYTTSMSGEVRSSDGCYKDSDCPPPPVSGLKCKCVPVPGERGGDCDCAPGFR